MSNIEDLAGFYWELYESLINRGFDEGQAMKIILKEAKVPRSKSVKKDVDLAQQLEDVLKRRDGKKKADTRKVR